MTARRLIVLGSTGSIGCNVLEVVAHLNERDAARFDVVGLAAGRNAPLLAEQSRQFAPQAVAIARAKGADELPSGVRVFAGEDAAAELVDAVAQPGDLVVGAIVGAAGLEATLLAIDRGCDVALANKETLVAAGELVVSRARERGVRLLPIDSEHSALAQCLRAGERGEIHRVVLTASGGPFRDARTWPRERLEQATVEEALNHPTWSMGRKITIDSASMMNKALEVIEAHWLFDLPPERIEVVVHPQSIAHGFVEFVDGSVVAQIGPPDMKTPIQYALTWPERAAGCGATLDWRELRALEFESVDAARFPAVDLAREVITAGGTAGTVFNAANEAAVEAFLDGAIPFGRILPLVEAALEAVPTRPAASLEAVRDADEAARAIVRQRLASVTVGEGRTG